MNSPKCGEFTQGKRRECEEGVKAELIVNIPLLRGSLGKIEVSGSDL